LLPRRNAPSAPGTTNGTPGGPWPYRDELLRLVEVSRWDGVDFTPLEPDWDRGPVQRVEGVVVDLGEVGLGLVAFSPRAVQEIEEWNGQISAAARKRSKGR
jgi:hypothetical protein